MIIYPGGSHHFYEKGKPSQRIDMLHRMIAWLSRWVEEPVPESEASGSDKPHSDGPDRAPR